MIYKRKNISRRGFTIIHVVIAVVAILAVGGGGVALMRKSKDKSRRANDNQASTVGQPLPGDDTPTRQGQSSTKDSSSSSVAAFNWQLRENGWQPTSSPSPCPSPMTFQPLADMTKVTAILYPGQTRGGNYKPHGGFRFDNQTDNNITVTAPVSAYAVQGGRYLVGGEIQYTFDLIHPCGYMYRVGHLLKLPDNLQKLADKFPEAKEGDSRTEFINPPVLVDKGDVLATAVGITKETNVFFDFGIYDLLKKNKSSENAAWAAGHDDLAQRAVCWFDFLPATDEATVRSLPAGDPESGKKSDYCQ